jgi:hypothetical protein
MTNFCQACGGQRGLHFSTLPGCTCVNPTPINYVINQQIKAAEWVGLTDEEIFSILENLQTIYNRPPTEDSRIIFAQAIEAKLKEKNT